MKRIVCCVLFLSVVCFGGLAGGIKASGGSLEEALQRWSRIQRFKDDMSTLNIRATWFSKEYLQALAEDEANKNLWTEDEKQNYLYNLLQTLQIDEYIPVEVEFNNQGPSMHMAPFDKMISLWVGKKEYFPVDYDKRFNFRLMGKQNGYVFFPRYDEKAQPILEGVKSIRLILSGNVSSTLKGGDVSFIWDIYKDNPNKLLSGKAMRQFEIDRLLKRVKKLNARKAELEEELKSIYEELLQVQKRMDEMQKTSE